MRSVLLVALVGLAIGCADRTALLVEVTSPDLAVPADIDALTIRAHTPSEAMFEQTFPVNTGWPHSLTILPAAGEGPAQVYVEVTGSRGGVFVVRRVALAMFVPGVTTRVSIPLTRACVDVRCGDDVDCIAGACQGSVDAGVDAATLPDTGVDASGDDGGSDAGSPDTGDLDGGGPDTGLDASGVDASRSDAGALLDAGAIDGGRSDAGSADAGVDVGPRDAGVDVGVDAGPRDAGSPPDAGPDCTAAACTGAVVISEFTTAGASSALDEFIELYNRGSGTASVGGCVLAYNSASGGTRTLRATIPAGVAIGSHRYYLLASGSFSGPGSADFTWPGTTGSADPGGTLTLECGGAPLDRIGYGSGVLAEGVAINPLMPAGGSYERRANATSTAASMSSGGADAAAGNAYDSDHNDLDWVVRALRDPQSSTSPAEP